MSGPLNWIPNRVLLWDGLAFVVSAILCIVFLIAGYLLIPRHSPVVARHFNLQLQSDPAQLQELSLAMAPTREGHYSLSIFVQTNTLSTVQLRFFFQPGVQAGCPKIAALPCTPAIDSDQNVLTIWIPGNTTVAVPVSASVFTFDSNGEQADGWLPNLACAGCSTDSTLVLRVAYAIPNVGDYNWDSGPPPGLTSGAGVWTQFAYQLQEPVHVSGTDPAAQRKDNEFIFAAGACAGIAGAMAATALQDGLTWAGVRRGRRLAGVQKPQQHRSVS